MAVKSRADLLAQRDALQPNNTAGGISPPDVREPGKDEIDSLLHPEDYQSGGLFIPPADPGAAQALTTTFAPISPAWTQQVTPSGGVSDTPADGVITLGTAGRYTGAFDITMELNATETVLINLFTDTAGGGFVQGLFGSLLKFRNNQIDLASTGFNVIFDIDPAALPFKIQPHVRSIGGPQSSTILTTHFQLTGWGRTND